MKGQTMTNRQQNNHFAKEIADMAKGLEDHESVSLGDESIIQTDPVDIPFPYGGGKPVPFGETGDFDDWSQWDTSPK